MEAQWPQRSRWAEEKGAFEEEWPEMGGGAAVTALGRTRSERVHCQQHQLL